MQLWVILKQHFSLRHYLTFRERLTSYWLSLKYIQH